MIILSSQQEERIETAIRERIDEFSRELRSDATDWKNNISEQCFTMINMRGRLLTIDEQVEHLIDSVRSYGVE